MVRHLWDKQKHNNKHKWGMFTTRETSRIWIWMLLCLSPKTGYLAQEKSAVYLWVIVTGLDRSLMLIWSVNKFLKLSSEGAFLILSGKLFHSGMVRGRKEERYQSFVASHVSEAFAISTPDRACLSHKIWQLNFRQTIHDFVHKW